MKYNAPSSPSNRFRPGGSAFKGYFFPFPMHTELLLAPLTTRGHTSSQRIYAPTQSVSWVALSRCEVASPMLGPPRDESELMARAHALCGQSVESLAKQHRVPLGSVAATSKGKVGTVVERALGATAGSKATWDFPALRVELKTIPVDANGKPRESTFVCTASLYDADRAEWNTAWVRAKLARVLWVPVRVQPGGARRIGEARLWSPSREQDRILAHDFEELLGRVGAGQIDRMTAHVGRWLQLRPKAAHSRVRTAALGAEGELVGAVPRGFYLRASFTGAILLDPMALPGEGGGPTRRKDSR